MSKALLMSFVASSVTAFMYPTDQFGKVEPIMCSITVCIIAAVVRGVMTEWCAQKPCWERKEEHGYGFVEIYSLKEFEWNT